MYKIFQENKALVFPKIEGDSLKFDATPQESERYDAELLCDFLPEWLDDRDPGDTFIHEVGENAVVQALKETFRLAPAAGGVVEKDGHFVKTGIGNLKIVKAMTTTWHCYLEHEEWALKPTYWYLMSTSVAIQPKPQTEEGITEIKLIGKEEIEGFLKNTFRSISEILGKELRQIVTK